MSKEVSQADIVSLVDFFDDLEDPRSSIKRKHLLSGELRQERFREYTLHHEPVSSISASFPRDVSTYPTIRLSMRFNNLILKNVLRRKFRSLLTLSAIATAIAAVVALRSISNGFIVAFEQVYSTHGVDLVVSRSGAADRLSSSVDMKAVERIETLPTVERAGGVLLETISLEKKGIYGIPAMGIEPDSWMLNDYRLKPPSHGFTKSNSKEVLLGAHLAERIHATVGDTIEIIDVTYVVVGIFESPSIWENGSVILPIGELQELSDRGGQYTYINVVLRKSTIDGKLDECSEAIKSLDPKFLPLATKAFVETDTRMNLVRSMAWLTSLISVIIGTIGTLNSTLTSVYERTQEIGVLRAIGWTKTRVISMILMESTGLAVVASLVGILAAAILIGVTQYSPSLSGLVPPRVSLATMLEGLLLAVLIGLLGAWLPAWRAVRMLPIDAFRLRSS
jgi:putative ABC transport system permease protein